MKYKNYSARFWQEKAFFFKNLYPLYSIGVDCMVVEAFSEAEARTYAKKFLGYSEGQFKISTVQEPVYQFWGTIKKKGKYNIILINNGDLKKNTKEMEDCKKGYVEIKDGKLNIYKPHDCRRYPSIIANDPNIIVYVNGEIRKNVIILNDKDKVEFKTKEVQASSHIYLELSEDKMKAVLYIKKEEGRVYCVKDVEKSNTTITVESYFKTILPEEVTLDSCLELIRKSNIKEEFINKDEIIKLIQLPAGGSAVVAKGIYPTPAMDTEIRYYFNVTEESEGEDNIVVQIGDVLAEKIKEAIPGIDGEDVTGAPIKAADPEESFFKPGSGTMYIEGHDRIVATINGRPKLVKGELRVIPLLVIHGDVNKDTGDIFFNGDVVIEGNIMDNMKVTAHGKINITGSVYNAVLFADEDILIGGTVMGGNVIAGLNMVNCFFNIPLLEKMVHVMNQIKEEIEKKEISEPMDTYAYDAVQGVIRVNVIEIEKTLHLQSDSDAVILRRLLNEIKDKFYSYKAIIRKDVKQIQLLRDELTYYIERKKEISTRHANVQLQYAQSTVIQACGTIIITGLGSYQSCLYAKEILYKRPTSSVKGGTLVAQKSIKAGEIGSPSGIHTNCRILNKDGKVFARYYNGTIVTIGDKVKIITKEQIS
ncbi:MAG: hypothetical protein K0S18_1746 [Anaerocolumna sp.]|jgi:uncharacterized protein (DUF342 family)|nr:hypothetical protein [Anaerocolumna sp.]